MFGKAKGTFLPKSESLCWGQGIFLSRDHSGARKRNSCSGFTSLIRRRATWRWGSGSELGSMDLAGSISYHTYVER